MNLTQTTPDTYDATKGQTICRASEWQDVARFFLLNYGLHVFTVFLPPGTSGPGAVREYVMSLVVPIYGITRSCRAIFTFARRARNQLDTALMSGALCMVVPADGSTTRVRCSARRERRVWIELRADAASRLDPKTTIHGQFPAGVWARAEDAESEVSTPNWCLRIVPKSFTVVAPIGPPAVPLQLSCNYKFLAASAGIVQVLSGSMVIYHASERQIPYFGYAAYSLTVVPYVIMSVVNLVGSMCQPQYPAMFLVRYCGPIPPAVISTDGDQVHLLPQQNDGVEQSSEVQSWTEPELGGIVGSAYGDLSTIDEEDTTLFKICNYTFHLLVGATPYFVMASLTHFLPAYSTVAQRTWIVLWLVCGQGYFIFLVIVLEVGKTLGFNGEVVAWLMPYLVVIGTFSLCTVVTSAIGGFVVVAQMIQSDKMCIRV